LARDIGQALGSGGYLTGLVRTRIGPYTLQDCMDINDFPAWLDKQTLQANRETEIVKNVNKKR
jgi:tRNA pseudouridine55 synthase